MQIFFDDDCDFLNEYNIYLRKNQKLKYEKYIFIFNTL